MATEVKRRRGTTAQHLQFTGAEAEITVDTDKYTLLVHDDSGSAPTGHELLRADFSNIPTSITSNITMNGVLTIDRSSASSGFALNILGSSQDNIRFLHDGRTIESTGVLNIDAGDADDENLNLNAAHIYINNNADVDGNLNITGEATASEFIGDLRGAVRFQVQADVAIAKGDAVYISGVSGNKPTVGLADANDATKMPAFGLAAGGINSGATGEIITFGTLSGIDTSSFTVGDVLYISDTGTSGNTLTATAPAGESSQIQNIGKIQRSHASAGSIKVGGAGRSNATPNLDQNKIFLGDSNNRAVSTALSSINLSSFNDDVVSGSYLPLTGGTITGDLIVKSTDAGAAADPNVTFFRDSASPADNDVLGDLLFSGRNDAATQVTYGRIASQIADASSTTHDGKLRFQVASNAALVTPLTIEGTASTFTTSVTATSFVKTANSGGFLKADGTEDTNTYLTSETSHADVLVDGDFTSNGLMKRTGAGTYGIVTDNSSNWNTAYGWGDHSTAGYLTTVPSEYLTETEGDARYLQLTGGTISSNLIISGNLTVSGTTTTVNTETIKLADNIILLNSNYDGETPTESAGIEIERGPSNTNKQFLWNETNDRWQTDDALYVSGALTATGNVTGSSIIKSGGTSSQFLKADGSVDSSTYLTSYTETDPIFSASAASGVTSGNITNWNLAYNNHITGVGFNTGTGVLTLTQNDADTITADLDGRYLELGGGTLTDSLTISSTGSAVMRITNTNASQSWIQYVGSNDDFIIRDETDSRTGLVIQGDGDVIMPSGNVGIGTTSPAEKLDVHGNVQVGGQSVTSSTTNHETVLRVKGKNNYSNGTTWYGDYGQIILHSNNNMTGSSRRFMITNALGNNKFAIVRSTDANTDPVVNSTNSGSTPNSGTADFVIDNTGNVGIGTTSPAFELDVEGTVQANNLKLQNLSTGSSDTTVLTLDQGQNVNVRTLGSNAFDSTSYLPITGGTLTGNLKLQNTTSTSLSKIDLEESSTQFFRLHHLNSGFTTSGTNIAGSALMVAGSGSTGGMVLRTDADAPIIFATNGLSNERMRIKGDGNVGIGETNPSYKLDVNGAGRFVNDLYANEDLVVANSIYLSDTNTEILEGNGNAIRHKTNSGYIDVGPQNTIWGHIYTDRPNFYFNKQLYVLGSKVWNAGNDGSGSTLDADLLDGQHGSYYTNATNLTSGTLNADRLPWATNDGFLGTYSLVWRATNTPYTASWLQVRGSDDSLLTRNIIADGNIEADDATFSGNVGIGTDSPSSTLTVNGTVEILSDDYEGVNEGGHLTLRASSNGTKRWNIDNYADSDLRFFTEDDSAANNGSVKMIILDSGNVGINNASPSSSYKLDVNGAGHFVNDLILDEDLVVDDTLYVGNTTTASHKVYVEGGAGHDVVAKFKTTGTGTSDYSEIHIENNTTTDRTILGSIGSNYSNTDWSNSSYLYNTGTGRRFLIKSQAEMIFTTGGTSLTNNKRITIESAGQINMHQIVKLESVNEDTNTTTALFHSSGQTIVRRTLGSNAFNSDTIPTNNNQLTNGAGYITSVPSALSANSLNLNSFNNDEGTEYTWFDSNSSSAGTTWYKVANIVLASGSYSGITLEVEYYYPNTNHGDNADVRRYFGFVRCTRSSGSDGNRDDAEVQFFDANRIRVAKTDLGEYELQARANVNNRAYGVTYRILSSGGATVTPATTKVAGNTDGGTVFYTGSSDDGVQYLFGGRVYVGSHLEVTGDLDVDGTDIVISDSLILGEDAYNASANYVGMKTSFQTGSNDYMIISGKSDGNTYVSARDGSSLFLRGGGNDSGNEIIVYDSGVLDRIDIDTTTAYFNGNVGIGTNSPGTDNLRVSGSGRVARISSTNDSVPLVVQNTSIATARIGFKGTTSTSDYHVSVGANGQNYTVYTDNAERMRINSSGNVGIGTINPDKKLHLSDASRVDILFERVGSEKHFIRKDGDYLRFRGHNDSNVLFELKNNTNGSNACSFPSGNVGIGNASPAQKLVVNGGVHAYGNISTPASGTYGLLMDFYIADSRFWSRGTTGGGTRGGFAFYQLEADGTNQITSFALDTSGNATFNYDLDVGGDSIIDGNVLIGTTTAQTGTKLQVAGQLDVWSSTNTLLRLNHDGTRGIIETFTGGNYSNTAINPNGGNVGIGTTGPDAVLHVNSNSFPETNEKLIRFNAGTANYQNNRYVEISNTFTGAGYYSPALVFKTNANSSNQKSYGLIAIEPDGSISLQNKAAGSEVAIGTSLGTTERINIDTSSTTKITSDGTNTAGTILELHFPNNNTNDRCATINLTNNVGGYAAIEGGTSGANNSGYIAFKTDNAGTQSEKVRILPSGGITFNGDTATANALDDYEEGTFTPSIHAGASSPVYHSNNYGKYTKIGNVVHCSGRFQVTSIQEGSSSTNVELGGFPFSCSVGLGNGTGAVAGSIGYASGFDGESPTMIQIRNNENNAFLYYQNSSLGISNLKGNDFTGSGAHTIVFQITYQTN